MVRGGRNFLICLDIPRCVGFLAAVQVFRGAGEDNVAAAVACLRTEVDDPVGRADDIGVMLDNHNRMASCEERVEGFE